MRLSDLETGKSAVIVKILGHGAFRKRVMEMGFVRGRKITAVLSAPMRDPVKYRLMDYEVLLRRSEAQLIEVVPKEEFGHRGHQDEEHKTTLRKDSEKQVDYNNLKVINVALLGNPNCGKTSLFNIASGASEHVGNYSGVTVDCKTGSFRHGGYEFRLVDLPGTYSLSAYSPEELYVRRYLKEENPDVILNVIDASNLERNLYLTTELIDMDHSMVIALNMYDELRNAGSKLDYQNLGRMIGVPIVPTVSRTGEGINELFDAIIAVYEERHDSVRHVHVNLGVDIERSVTEIKDILKKDHAISQHFSPRYLAIKLLEGDKEAESLVAECGQCGEVLKLRDRSVKNIEASSGEDISSLIAAEKYGFISGALAETLMKSEVNKVNTTHIIDAFVTSRLFGFPIFILLMVFIFWMTFSVGAYPQGWIEDGCSWLGSTLGRVMSDGPLKDLVIDGVIGGVGGVMVFLPNILILYFFISFMEDSGYMARAAFIMDKLMHKIGLHGKSFIPLIMGFGCNVPAIMACRSIESPSSRIITVLINPFVSCSARLPIYVLLIGTFFGAHAALVLSAVYLLGILVAVFTAKMLRRFFFKQDVSPFVMELPPYRVPTMKNTARHMWWKARSYLKKMGGIILIGSIAVWALNYFPHHSLESSTPEMQAEIVHPTSDKIDTEHDSYLEMMGKTIAPVFKPLGFDWRSTVAIIAGIPAKEIVVSTLGVLYTGDSETLEATLGAKIKAPDPRTGNPGFTGASALAFIVFVLLYCPCIATVTAIVRETHDWRYGVFSVIYNTAVAWILAFLVYRLALLF